MASQWQWKTDSTATYTPPTPPALTAAQTLPPLQIPPWGKPTTSVPFKPTPAVAGSLVKPYIFPLPPEALDTGPGPTMPIPPNPPGPTPPPSGELVAPGPQTPPMGPFGPPAGP